MKFNKNDNVVIINTDDIWENKQGIILGDFNNNEITDETEEYLVKIFFDNDKTIIQPFNQENLKVIDITEQLNENKKTNIKDFIYDYVYLTDIDDNRIPSWFFVDKISAAENTTSDKIIEIAKKLNYKLFLLTQNNYKKIIVAAPKCKIDNIYDEYANYLLGSAVVKEIVYKGEK